MWELHKFVEDNFANWSRRVGTRANCSTVATPRWQLLCVLRGWKHEQWMLRLIGDPSATLPTKLKIHANDGKSLAEALGKWFQFRSMEQCATICSRCPFIKFPEEEKFMFVVAFLLLEKLIDRKQIAKLRVSLKTTLDLLVSRL